MAKSYFAILGISSGATADEVRSAYRRLAKEYHPDYYAGGSERFQDIQEAYAVLGNNRRRHDYEQSIRKASLNGCRQTLRCADRLFYLKVLKELMPPSMGRTCPVIQAPASESK